MPNQKTASFSRTPFFSAFFTTTTPFIEIADQKLSLQKKLAQVAALSRTMYRSKPETTYLSVFREEWVFHPYSREIQ
jgi:hypothetical protein